MAINEKSGTEQSLTLRPASRLTVSGQANWKVNERGIYHFGSSYSLWKYGGSLIDTQTGRTGNECKHLDRMKLSPEINICFYCFFKKLL